MIEYNGYIGVIDFDPEIDLFHGTVINTQDVITFYGSSVVELRQEMQKSLGVYFEVCKEQEKVPDKPSHLYVLLILLFKYPIILRGTEMFIGLSDTNK